jgi:2-dehydro-3-deoxyphosphooctonate aldolase (KDO 8-P synthase)
MTETNSEVAVGEGAGKVVFSNTGKLSLIAGPCQMESRDHAFMIAGTLKELCDKLGIGLVYKSSFDKANRTSLSAQRGIGLETALEVFADLKKEYGFPVLTDIHTEEQCAEVATVVDVLQIPAFLSRQTDLLVAAAKTGRAINVKKGQFLAPWDMKNVLAKLNASGNPNIMLCERGASFGYNTLVSDMRSLPIMASPWARLSCSTPRIRCSSRAGRAARAAASANSSRRWRVPPLPLASPVCSSRRTKIPTMPRQMDRTWSI